MKVATTRCSRVGAPELRIQFNEHIVLQGDAIQFIGGLEEAVLEGERYRDGETLQVGWAVALFKNAENGTLAVWEPDMKTFPMRFIDSVTNILMHLRLQRDVADSVDLEPDFPSMRDAGVCCTWLERSSKTEMIRWERSGRASGWFVSCGLSEHNHEDTKNLARESLYAIALLRPSVIEFLALPAGSGVRLLGSELRSISLERRALKPKVGSYLAAKGGGAL